MLFNLDKDTGCSQKSRGFCCAQKRDLLRDDNFEKTINIFPRIILIKNLKLFEVYCETITIRNTGTLCRTVKFITEPNNDITLKINGNTSIQPGSHVSVDISVEATKKKLINQNRYLFVLAEHPDIIWEIPLIVLRKDQEIYVPEIICLPKVPANSSSNYQFLVYNPKDKVIMYSICSNYGGFAIKPISGYISAKDYSKILITGKFPLDTITTSLVLTLKNGKSFKIFVRMELSNQLIHLSTSELILEDTYIGLNSEKNLFICNRSNECVSFRWSNSTIVENLETDDEDEDKFEFSEFVAVRKNHGCIPALSSIASIFTFTPPENFDYDEDESKFQIDEHAYLFCPLYSPQSYRVHISGKILGPNIEINPTVINVGSLYMGQIHCLSLEVLNKEPISGEIYFTSHTDQNEINCSVTPLSTYLKPDDKKSIELSFYRRDVGKFLTKLNFKIKSGDFLWILLRGVSLPTKVTLFPEIYDFGDIPICIPQKGSVEIFNPLPVPIMVDPTIFDDGDETPLILCVDNLNLPLDTRTTTYYNDNSSACEFKGKDLETSCSDFSSNKEISWRTNVSSEISSLFQKKVLDDIPAVSTDLLKDFKNIHSKDQLEIGMKIIDASLDYFLDRCDYFQELRNNKNYLNMNWKALPCDAKEIAIEEEHFYLEPNGRKHFPLALVPNSSGPTTKSVQFRVHPINGKTSNFNDTINSSHMTSSLRLHYNCMIPALEYNNDIFFSEPVYADMENTFNMNFKNIDIVPGFVYFKVIPTSTSGIIKVKENQQKFFITPGEKIEVECSVIFRKIGKIVLHGIFQVVGKLLEYSFEVEAQVLPPEIQISMEKIFKKQEVLELTRTKLFITNTSPTVAQLIFSLKNEKYQFLEPLGASLAPNQKIIISIFSKFLDPGLYKNALNINLKHAENIIIPITFSIEGAPLKFEPNIQLGLDLGILFKNQKLQEDIILIENLGEKSYKINFEKKIPKKLAIIPIPHVINFEPNILKIRPNGQEIVKIQLDTSKEIKSEEEFNVDGVINDAKHRFKLFSFTAKCNVIEPRVLWSKNELCFNVKNPQLNENKAFGIVSIINTTPFVANIDLNVQGNFILGENCENIKEKFLEFSMKGKTSKEIYVSLDENEINEPNLMCQCFKGLVKCKVNNKTQKSLPLHVKIVGPALRICTPKVTLFPPYSDSFAHINIHNCSHINATFNWKEVESKILERSSSELYVEEPYSKTISELILSIPKETVPKFPNSIRTQCSEDFLSDSQESSDEESTSHTTKSNVINEVADLKQKSSSSLKTDTFSASSLSLRSLKSERTFFQPNECKPIPFCNVDTQNIGLDEIFEYLGLSDKPSSEHSRTVCKNSDLDGDDTKCNNTIEKIKEPIKIGFQHKSGQIAPKSMFKAYIFLPTLPKDKTMVSKYNLHVIGGQTEVLDLTVTSQRARIQVSKTDINLGINIWYKTILDKIRIESLSQYAIKITIVNENEFTHQKKHLTGGHVEIISPKQFILQPKTSTEIEFNICMGFISNFSQSIGLEINNNTTSVPIRIIGSGVFPMVVPIKLKRISQPLNDIVQNYFHLRDIFNDRKRKYYFGEESALSHISSELEEHTPKRTLKRKQNDGVLLLNYSDEKALSPFLSELEKHTPKRTLKRNKSDGFLLLNYSDETYPRPEEIERILESENFVFNLYKSNELMTTFDKYSRKCMLLRAMEFDPVINLKHTICRPIPWQCSAFCYNMNNIRLNETNNFEIEMLFIGPGRLFLSLRTEVVVPGLAASFESSLVKDSFVYFYQSPDDNILKGYKNIHERSSDTEVIFNQNTKANNLHSHSYDFDEAGVHQRQVLSNEIKQIKEHYTKINQPVKEKKNPFILTEICQATTEELNELPIKLNLNLKLTTTNEFYERNQVIEDYLFIDIHLGPTIPILLKGKVTST
ncbi:uncharacterized protein LOC129951691 [Eupeodes corollae]|uniref:uncharacterized protein LOC129951691 n=1 Tax=Eupeodes corollae TaxID=290404 RepID=UPI00248F88B1|nr:uncharacterized protein LOC129951691 [Eupeodes corollae]